VPKGYRTFYFADYKTSGVPVERKAAICALLGALFFSKMNKIRGYTKLLDEKFSHLDRIINRLTMITNFSL